jgi:predicted HD superfamily hydrolase involved in NAD metabolism
MPISKRSGSIDSDGLYAAVLAALGKRLTPARIRHSAAVSRLAAELCLRHGLDGERGRLAGIGHDIARELSADETFAALERFRLRPPAWQREHPVTLHGLVGREILKREFDIRDGEILAAVAEHVLGRPGMGKLSQILYAADFLEPERGFLSEPERTALLRLSLPAMVARVTEKIFAYLEAWNKPIAPVSKKMYDYFKRRAKESAA